MIPCSSVGQCGKKGRWCTQVSGMRGPDSSADDATGPVGGKKAILLKPVASCWS